MIDYIMFDYNRSEYSLFKKFCDNLGIDCIIRYGYLPINYIDDNAEFERVEPSTKLCNWLWHIAILNWDGSLLPCCQFPVASTPIVLGTIAEGKHSMKSLWNGQQYRAFRRKHIQEGRSAIYVCDRCDWEDIGLQAQEETKQSQRKWAANL
jgi:radical SAM protein with 4Fe4S-binding SPASM domain